MNIEFIEGFLETARHKSIAKASERLQISHPALSKQIRSIESYYGVTVFKRSSVGVELTEEGTLLFERLQPLVIEWMKVKNEFNQRNSIRIIHLGTLPSLAANYLPNKVLAMEQRQVSVDLTIRHTSQELYLLLEDGTIDAALLEKGSSLPSLWSVDLYTEPF